MKSLTDIKIIGVAGAGTMGAGIAQVAILAGYNVLLFDVLPQTLETAKKTIDKNLNKAIERQLLTESEKNKAIERLKIISDLNELRADLIIEAIIEKAEPKIDLFNRLAAINPDDCIFATNTSSIPVTRIAAKIPHPERVVGMHFFNPAHIMKLVEVISGATTAPEIVEVVYALSKKMGKVPVLAKDSPGFIVNRVARHYYVESLKVLEENVADFLVIDQLLEATGFKMGPFRLMDLIGVDTNFSVTSSLFESFHQDSKFRPSRIQQQKVEAGLLGRKTGMGFYDYRSGS